MNDNEVKILTGFANVGSLLMYKMIVYNSDLDKMTNAYSELTWFEEMMLQSELKWGRSKFQWEDVEKEYHTQKPQKIFDKNLGTKLRVN